LNNIKTLIGLGAYYGIIILSIVSAIIVGYYFLGGGATTAVIGPQTVVTGELVVLAAEDLEGKAAASYAWTVVPDTVQVREMENKKVLVAVFDEPGEYAVILATASGGGVTQSAHYVAVADKVPTPQPEPQPGPKPGPEPEPKPEPKPDASEWSSWVYDLAVKTVNDPKRAEQAELMAGQFRSVAAMIAAGAIKSPREARAEIRSVNNLILGSAVASWVEFSQSLAGHMAGLTVDGELTTLKQYQAVYLGIADGLDRVAVHQRKETIAPGWLLPLEWGSASGGGYSTGNCPTGGCPR
jgi:hypothetical protein